MFVALLCLNPHIYPNTVNFHYLSYPVYISATSSFNKQAFNYFIGLNYGEELKVGWRGGSEASSLAVGGRVEEWEVAGRFWVGLTKSNLFGIINIILYEYNSFALTHSQLTKGS